MPFEAYSTVMGSRQGLFPATHGHNGIGHGRIETLSFGYLGHVLAWGDAAYVQSVEEQMNQAISLYSSAQQILGPPPAAGSNSGPGPNAGLGSISHLILRVDGFAALSHFRRAHADKERLDIVIEIFDMARSRLPARSYHLTEATLIQHSILPQSGATARARFPQELSLSVPRR